MDVCQKNIEVCRNAQFYELEEVADYNRTLRFIGQAKGGKEKAEQPYEIPCYVENIELLIENMEQVQEFGVAELGDDFDKFRMNCQEFQSLIYSTFMQRHYK